MSKQGEQAKERARAVNAARDQGLSASEAGVSQGASKQTSHATHAERPERNAPLHEEKGKT